MSSARNRRGLKYSALVTVPAVVAALAFIDPGVPIAEVDLNDGSVWVTTDSDNTVGRFNPILGELTGGVVSISQDFDVQQDGGQVLLEEPGTGAIIDPAVVALGGQVSLPPLGEIQTAGGTAAVHSTETGDFWVSRFSELSTIDYNATPTFQTGRGGTGLVTQQGTVLGVATDGQVTRGTWDDQGLKIDQPTKLNSAAQGQWQQLTAVGEELVGLTGTKLVTANATVDLSGYGQYLTLQQVGPAHTKVLVAARNALLEIDLKSGAITEFPDAGTGQPAAPVVLQGCYYAAWAGENSVYQRICGADARAYPLEFVTAASELVFRVNRNAIVLNDVTDGVIWTLEDPPKRHVPNWADVQPEDQTEEEENLGNDFADALREPECRPDSPAPQAVDDSYGVRAGRTIVLTLIDNDGASDCGIMGIREFDQLPESFGTLTSIYGGQALQLTVAPGASGTQTFTYTISDERGLHSPSVGTVTLSVRSDDTNEAPEQLRTGSVAVELEGRVTYNVLRDFQDPDGDELMVMAAVSSGEGTVRPLPDGRITYSSNGNDLGRHEVKVVVSDGENEVEGSFFVEVRPARTVPPKIDPILVETYTDVPVTVDVLAAVVSSSREEPRLVAVDQVEGTTVTAQLAEGRFRFTTSRAGTFYVSFRVVSGGQEATGLARIDVRETPEEFGPPVAVRDTVYLPIGDEVVADPLANDFDPAGGVLVLQSVTLPDGAPVQPAILNYRMVRFTAQAGFREPVVATYTISNGTQSATGEILVQPAPAADTQQPPVVPDLEVSVRTGGVVTIAALAKAYDPDGDSISLSSEITQLPEDQGLLFISGNQIRYQAPDAPVAVDNVVFTVLDSAGNATSALLKITVHEPNAETKQPPSPVDVTARVYQGETVRIPIQLVGIDPDGDGIVLLGLDRAPTKGRVIERGADYFIYEPLAGELGTDEFTYAVEDWVGQRSVAKIRVGIAPRPTEEPPLIARNDEVYVRPGLTVDVRVMANDVSPDGSELILSEELEMDEGIDATVVDDRVFVTVPDEPGVLHITYRVSTQRGASAHAVLTVHVEADAAIRAPIAQDVTISPVDAFGLINVPVDVLSRAQNPSGPQSDLDIRIPARYGSVATVQQVDGRPQVVITLLDRAQMIAYELVNTAENAEGVSSFAFISVPAKDDFPPTLRPGAPKLEPLAGQSIEIRLLDHIWVAQGKEPFVHDVESVTAAGSDGSSLVIDNQTLTYKSRPEFSGPAEISFRVTDSANPSDPAAKTVLLSIPINVLSVEENPPSFAPSTLEVAPGEAANTVDLRVFTSAPTQQGSTDDDYTYHLTSVPAGFEASVTGSVLSLSTPVNTPKGTVGVVVVELGYGDQGATMEVSVPVRVIASSRPPAAVSPLTISDAVAGQTSTAQVLSGAFNPFPAAGPLRVIEVSPLNPEAATASTDGTQVSVTPAADFIGTTTVTYVVEDPTGDVGRRVEGRIQVVVSSVPEAPSTPIVVSEADRSVVLRWDAPTNNGRPIDSYRVTAASGGTVVQECAATTCEITGLTNGTGYTFTVAAHNEVGWSAESPVSVTATPDIMPGTPTNFSVAFGDGQLQLSWGDTPNTGSPITAFEVMVDGGVEMTIPGGGSARSYTLRSINGQNIVNGKPYRLQLRAVNSAGGAGEGKGPWTSAVEQIPAGRPAPPAAPYVERVSSSQGGKFTVTITRLAGADTGGDEPKYRVIAVEDPAIAWDVPAGVNTVEIPVGTENRNKSYTFRVWAWNKANPAQADWVAGAQSAAAVAYSVPDKITAQPTITPSSGTAPGAGTFTARWTAPDNGGNAITGYRVRVGSTEHTVEGNVTHFLLPNTYLGGSTNPVVTVRACNQGGCQEAWSPDSEVKTVYTKPANPTITLSPGDNATQVRVSATLPSDKGGHPTVDWKYLEYRIPGTSQSSWTAVSDGDTITLNDVGQYTVEVRGQVRALPSAGGEQLSAEVTETHAIVKIVAPGAAQNLTFSYASGVLLTQWQAPANKGGATALSYDVKLTYVQDGVTHEITANGGNNGRTGLSADFNTGELGLQVTVSVVARNTAGPAPALTGTFDVPAPPPPPETPDE